MQEHTYTVTQLHSLIGDYKRTNAYAEFLTSGICKGKTVVDCGAGSGLCSYLALLGGAKSVIACDISSEICDYLNLVFAHTPEVSVVQLNLCTDVLPAGDLYIHEIIGNALLGEGVSDMFSNMRSQNITNIYPAHAKISVGEVCYTSVTPAENSLHHLHTDAKQFTEFLPDFVWNNSFTVDYTDLVCKNVQTLYHIDLCKPLPEYIKEADVDGDIIWQVGFDSQFDISYTNINDQSNNWKAKTSYKDFIKNCYIESF